MAKQTSKVSNLKSSIGKGVKATVAAAVLATSTVGCNNMTDEPNVIIEQPQPSETTTQKSENGTVITTYNNPASKIESIYQFPDGTEQTNFRDGTVKVVFADVTTYQYPAGSEITTLTEYADGTTQTVYVSGETVTKYPQGITQTTSPNGSKQTIYADGTMVTEYPKNNDVSSVTTYPNGNKVTTFPNGDVKTDYATERASVYQYALPNPKVGDVAERTTFTNNAITTREKVITSIDFADVIGVTNEQLTTADQLANTTAPAQRDTTPTMNPITVGTGNHLMRCQVQGYNYTDTYTNGGQRIYNGGQKITNAYYDSQVIADTSRQLGELLQTLYPDLERAR